MSYFYNRAMTDRTKEIALTDGVTHGLLLGPLPWNIVDNGAL